MKKALVLSLLLVFAAAAVFAGGESESKAGAEKVKLLWYIWDDPEKQGHNLIAQDYMDRNPNYEIEISRTPFSKYEETIHLPPGWTVAHVPENKDISNDAADLHFEVESAPDYIRYRFSIAIKEMIVSTENYSGYKKVVDAMNDIAKGWIVCHKDDTHSRITVNDSPTEEVLTHAKQ